MAGGSVGGDVAPAGEVWPHTLLCGRRRRLRQLRNPGITGLASTRRWWVDEEERGGGGGRNIREVGYIEAKDCRARLSGGATRGHGRKEI